MRQTVGSSDDENMVDGKDVEGKSGWKSLTLETGEGLGGASLKHAKIVRC